MKRLLFGFLSLYIVTPLWADSVTSGAVGLLKPSTRTVDSTRSWADKLNVNFDIIAATMNGIIGGQFGTGSEPQSFILFKDTAQAKIKQLAIDTGTIVANFGAFTSTSDAQQAKFVNFRSTTDAAINSTGTAIYQYAVFNATNTNLIHSTNTWDAAQAFISSVTFSSPTITFAGVTMLMQSTRTIGDVGDDILHRNRVSSQTYWGGDNTGGTGGSGGLTPDQGATTYMVLAASQVVTGAPTFHSFVNFDSSVTVKSSATAFLFVSTPVGSGGFIGNSSTFSFTLVGTHTINSILYNLGQSSFTGVVIFSSNVQLAAGGVTLPAIYMAGENSTGWYRGGANIWSFSAAGVNTLLISGSALNMGGGKQVGVFTGSEGVPSINSEINTNGLWLQDSPADIHMEAASVSATIQTWFRTNKIQLGLMKATGQMSAGVTITTMGVNLALLNVDSVTTIAQVTGASVTVSVPFLIAPTTTYAFTNNQSSFVFVVTTGPVKTSDPLKNYAVGVSSTGYLILGSSAVVPHVLSGCGTSPSIYGGGNAFYILPGATANGCTITFGTPFTNPPIAVVTPRTGSLVNSFSYTVSNTQLVITETSLSSIVDVILAPPTP